MSKMWHGPSVELKAAYESPSFRQITRRCGRHGIFFTVAHDGRSAEVFDLIQQRGDWVKRSLGTVNGLSPFDTALRVAFDHTPFDAEFVEQRGSFICDRIDSVIAEIKTHQRIDAELDTLAGVLALFHV